MKIRITYIFRKPNPKYKSIEGVFHRIADNVNTVYESETINLPYAGGDLITLWRNIKQFKVVRNTICHITGDIHYMSLVTGKKSVLTVHDVKSIVKGSVLKQFYMKLFWFWLPALFVKRITVISEFTRVELEKLVPFAKRKIIVVYNPVSEIFQRSRYHFNKTKPRILLLGTKPNKNVYRVLESLKDIHCTITLIGQPTTRQQELIVDLKLDLVSKFNLTNNQIVAEYEACDIVCFASTYEGFGMPIIEAQSVGRPVVTSNFGAMKEVAGDAAVLVDPYDVDSISTGILGIINNVNLREDLIIKGSQNIKRFSAEAIAKAYMALYKEIISSMGIKA